METLKANVPEQCERIEKAQTLQTGAPAVSGKLTTLLPSSFLQRYKSEDVKRLFGTDSYDENDILINVIAEGEGKFDTSGDVKDNAGLSVGIFQWTQLKGQRLSELMQRYKDTAIKEGKAQEFYETFGGKTKAEDILKRLKENPGSLSLSEIQPMFHKAGKNPVFQKAQIELARQDLPLKVENAFNLHPYTKNNSLSKQSVAISAIASNIGPYFLGKIYNQATVNVYNDLVKSKPNLAIKGATMEQMREVVINNVSEQDLNKEFVNVAPNILYSQKNAKFRAGTQNRMIRAMEVFPPTSQLSR